MNLSALSQHIPLDTVYEDEVSDSLSSEDFSQNFSPRSNKENNPYYQQQFTTDCDSEVSSQTKKIRKKRTAYQKIDDDIRIQLWEAVQQNGESLKCAAKRLNINYSSAKSILHTYRKEGRILKKSALERTINICNPSDMEMTQYTLPPLSLNDFAPNKTYGFQPNFQTLDIYQESTATTTSYGENSPPSPMHGLADNLCQISLEPQYTFKEQRLTDEITMPKPQLPSLRPLNKPKLPLGEIINESSSITTQTNAPSPIIPAFRLPSNHQPGNPLDALKHLDNFYMNYSNSPLSGNNKMFQESSDSGSRSKYPKEFDSFSDMVTCLQGQPRAGDETKGDIQIPKPLKLNTMQMMQDNQLMKEESPNWTKNLENAAFDTYKSFMDAQFLLQNALNKANHLNNLVQLQKTGVSPTNTWKL